MDKDEEPIIHNLMRDGDDPYTDNVPSEPFLADTSDPEETISNISAFEKSQFFIDATKELETSLSRCETFSALELANRKFQELLSEMTEEEESVRAFDLLDRHYQKIVDGKFDWVYDHPPIILIAQIFEFFDVFYDDRHFKFLNFDTAREFLPISYFIAYFKHPFSANDDDVVTYGEIMNFHSTLLSVFVKLYIRSFFAFRPLIDATEIYTIDPFMRNEFRKTNLEYYIENFWETDDFEIYDSLKNLFEEFILAGLPKWITDRGSPFAVHLLDLVRLLFEYGLISYDFCKSLISYLYLTSETLKNLETKLAESDIEAQEADRCRSSFRLCRENISEILIHVLTLFNDVSFEDSLLKIRQGKKKIVYYQGFLFDDKASYNFFCSILIKYLTNHVALNKPIASDKLDRNLTIIFNFLGDFQNDNFNLSLDLVRQSYYKYYVDMIEGNSTATDTVMNNAANILNAVMSFIELIKNPQDFLDTNTGVLKLVKTINNIFEENPITTEFRLELCRNGFIGSWLSVIDMLDDTKEINDVVDQTLIILKDVMLENYPGQSVLFRGAGYRNFFNIVLKYDLSALIFLKEVFEKDSSLLFLSQDIFMLYLNIYSEKLYEIFELINQFGNNYNNSSTTSFVRKVGTLFFYNAYFDTILEDHLIKIRRRKRYDLLLAQVLEGFIRDYVINTLVDSTFLDDYSDLSFKKNLTSRGLEDRKQIEVILAEQNDSKRILFQFYYSTLKIYNKATYKIYTGEIYGNIKNLKIQKKIKEMNISYPESVLLRLEFVKLFERFFVFFPNHLITKRIKFNKYNQMFLGEHFIPLNYEEVRDFVLEEFKWFSNFINYHNNKSRELLMNIQKYIYKGLLSLIYKFLKGIMVNLTKLQDDKLINKLKEIVDVITDEFETRLPQFKRMIEVTSNPNPLDNINDIIKNGDQEGFQTDAADQTNEIEEILNEVDNKEERINPNLKAIRSQLRKGIKEINQLYKDSNVSFIIARNVRLEGENKRGAYIKKLFRSPNEVKLKNLRFLNKIKQVGNNMEYNTQFKFLRNKYMMIKTLFQEGQETNQFYNVLSSIKDSHKNLENIIGFFINQFSNLEFEIKPNRLHLFYLNNEFFFPAVIILDNLMSWNNKVRIHFYDVLVKMDPEKRKNLFRKLWGTFISLYLLVTFKTFMDDQWQIFWSLFFILSNFFQNFNEENNLNFKKFFSDTSMNEGAISKVSSKIGNFNQSNFTIFFENYIMLENVGNFTNFWLNTDANIMPSDRVEFFPIFVRMFTMVNEYLTGPCLENQRKIYRYRIDIWNGIIVRIIDDVNSNFYEVKLACLTYISSLLEGLDNEIVSFMASNFQIDKLFNMINRLTKKLFVRQKLVKMNKIKNTTTQNVLRSNFKKFMSAYNQKIEEIGDVQAFSSVSSNITIEQEREYTIKDYKELIKMYKKYSSSFSDHVIARVIISTYVLLINMSFKIKFFEFFFTDKRKEVVKLKKGRHSYSKTKIEEIIIYQFLDNITSNIELIYENENDKTKKLMRIFYMIPPECFFLTEEMKGLFLDNIDYETTVSKHIDLFDAVEPFHIEMQANKTYYTRFGVMSYLVSNEFFRANQFILYFWSVLLNLMMMFYIIVDETKVNRGLVTPHGITPQSPFIIRRSGGDLVILIFAIYIAIHSLILTVSWMMFKYRLEVDLNVSRKLMLGKEKTFQLLFYTYVFDSFLFHPRFISFFLHLVFTLLGIVTNNYFFYTLNLFLLTNLFQTINYILKSIVKHYGKLLITLLLTVLVIFCYSFLAYLYYSGDNHEDFENVCRTFVTCFFNSVNLGLRLGGGISDAFNLKGDLTESNEINSNTGHFFSRFFFDLTFFIFIKLIFLNLIAGIIIDTFGDMRDELNRRNYDVNNVCSICGKSRWQLEKEGILFSNHIRYNHSLWRYLYYMIRLKTVKASNFTGIEQYVFEKTENDDSSWIPQGIYLKNNENIEDIS